MRRGGCLLLILLVLIAQSGGLQVVAWISMAVRSGDVTTVFRAAPCSACQAAQALQDDEVDGGLGALKKLDQALPAAPIPVAVVTQVIDRLQMQVLPGRAQWSPVPDVPPPCVG